MDKMYHSNGKSQDQNSKIQIPNPSFEVFIYYDSLLLSLGIWSLGPEPIKTYSCISFNA